MTQSFRVKPGFTTTDGHRYVSVPVAVPTRWVTWRNADGLLCYRAESYVIVRQPYGPRKFTYRLDRYVDGKPVVLGRLYSRLVDAQNDACKNARGKHVVNWA